METTQPKRLVAILTYAEGMYRPDFDDYSGVADVADTLSEWVEVTDEEYELLKKAQYARSFLLVEKPSDLKTFVKQTVESELEIIREAQRKLEEARAKRRGDEARAEEKKRQRKLKQLQKLQEEFGIKPELGEGG
jgi:hypothetical protein